MPARTIKVWLTSTSSRDLLQRDVSEALQKRYGLSTLATGAPLRGGKPAVYSEILRLDPWIPPCPVLALITCPCLPVGLVLRLRFLLLSREPRRLPE